MAMYILSAIFSSPKDLLPYLAIRGKPAIALQSQTRSVRLLPSRILMLSTLTSSMDICHSHRWLVNAEREELKWSKGPYWLQWLDFTAWRCWKVYIPRAVLQVVVAGAADKHWHHSKGDYAIAVNLYDCLSRWHASGGWRQDRYHVVFWGRGKRKKEKQQINFWRKENRC